MPYQMRTEFLFWVDYCFNPGQNQESIALEKSMKSKIHFLLTKMSNVRRRKVETGCGSSIVGSKCFEILVLYWTLFLLINLLFFFIYFRVWSLTYLHNWPYSSHMNLIPKVSQVGLFCLPWVYSKCLETFVGWQNLGSYRVEAKHPTMYKTGSHNKI